MNNQNIAICGVRYGTTKAQAEQIKKYIEENSLIEIKITIVDSESKQKLDKIKKYVAENLVYVEDSDDLETILSIITGDDLEKIIGGNDEK